MYEIIRISNCGSLFNGLILTTEEFNTIISALELSNFIHTITFKDLRNNEVTKIIKILNSR